MGNSLPAVRAIAVERRPNLLLPMKKTIYNIINSTADHRKFGGIVYPSDFNTSYTNGSFASRTANDFRFDEQCRKNLTNLKMN